MWREQSRSGQHKTQQLSVGGVLRSGNLGLHDFPEAPQSDIGGHFLGFQHLSPTYVSTVEFPDICDELARIFGKPGYGAKMPLYRACGHPSSGPRFIQPLMILISLHSTPSS